MRLVISVPPPIFEAAEVLARQLGKSRSRLHAEAVAEYVGQRSDGAIRRKLDEVHGRQVASLDKAMASVQARALPDEAW